MNQWCISLGRPKSEYTLGTKSNSTDSSSPFTDATERAYPVLVPLAHHDIGNIRLYTFDGLTAGFQNGKQDRSEEHTSELQSRGHLVCRLLLEKKNRIEINPELPNLLLA